MQAVKANEVSKQALWTGWIMSGLVALFMLFESIIHILVLPPVVESFAELGYPIDLSVALGVVQLICIALYLVPRTSVLGAILLTGHLGGAVAAQARIGTPLFSYVLFPVYVSLLAWGGLYVRDEQLRALIPLRR